MADYPHTRGGLNYRQAMAKARPEHPSHAAAIWAGVSLVVLALMAWLWLRQAPAPSPALSDTPAAAGAAPAPAKPAGLVVQVVQTTPPPSADVAAAGDTRVVRP